MSDVMGQTCYEQTGRFEIGKLVSKPVLEKVRGIVGDINCMEAVVIGVVLVKRVDCRQKINLHLSFVLNLQRGKNIIVVEALDCVVD